MPDITILIITFDRRDFLERCLSCIYETSTTEERNVIIWDNASEDDTPDFLGTMVGFKGIRVLRSPTNVGSSARQRMLKLVDTPYVLSLDDDAWLTTPGWATAAGRAMDQEPEIGMLAIGSGQACPTNNFGVIHGTLDEPFFRCRPIVSTGPLTRHIETPYPGTEIREIAGYQVQIHLDEAASPYPISGACCLYRTDMVRRVTLPPTSGIMSDMAETWGQHTIKSGGRSAVLLQFGFLHPCPGPLWHLGRNERYWKKKCEQSPQIYNRTYEEQWKWYEQAREWSGWGQTLENADEAC